MNLVDCYVTKVFCEPYYTESFGVAWWSVDVEYVSWGATASGTRTFKTREAALEVKEGFHFLA